MSEQKLKELLDWLKEKQQFHEDLASKKNASGAYSLNHNSRALAFLQVYTEIKIRFSKEPA